MILPTRPDPYPSASFFGASAGVLTSKLVELSVGNRQAVSSRPRLVTD